MLIYYKIIHPVIIRDAFYTSLHLLAETRINHQAQPNKVDQTLPYPLLSTVPMRMPSRDPASLWSSRPPSPPAPRPSAKINQLSIHNRYHTYRNGRRLIRVGIGRLQLGHLNPEEFVESRHFDFGYQAHLCFTICTSTKLTGWLQY